MENISAELEQWWEDFVLDGVTSKHKISVRPTSVRNSNRDLFDEDGNFLWYSPRAEELEGRIFQINPPINTKPTPKSQIRELPKAVERLNNEKNETRSNLERLLSVETLEGDSQDSNLEARYLFENLKKQFANPYEFIRELAQNSDGATIPERKNEINVELRTKEISDMGAVVPGTYSVLTFSDRGSGMSQEVVDDVFLGICASLFEDNPNAEGEFGVGGGISPFVLEPEYVIVESLEDGGSPAGVIIDKDIMRHEFTPDINDYGTVMHILMPEDFSFDTEEIEKISDYYLEFLRTPIIFSDGSQSKQLTKPFKPSPELSKEDTIEFDEEGVDGFLEYRPGEGEGIRVMSRYITLMDWPDEDLTGAINYNGLPKTISRNAITDSGIEKLLKDIVEIKKEDLLSNKRSYDMENDFLTKLSLVEKVGELDRVSRTFVKEPVLLPEGHIEDYVDTILMNEEKKEKFWIDIAKISLELPLIPLEVGAGALFYLQYGPNPQVSLLLENMLYTAGAAFGVPLVAAGAYTLAKDGALPILQKGIASTYKFAGTIDERIERLKERVSHTYNKTKDFVVDTSIRAASPHIQAFNVLTDKDNYELTYFLARESAKTKFERASKPVVDLANIAAEPFRQTIDLATNKEKQEHLFYLGKAYTEFNIQRNKESLTEIVNIAAEPFIQTGNFLTDRSKQEEFYYEIQAYLDIVKTKVTAPFISFYEYLTDKENFSKLSQGLKSTAVRFGKIALSTLLALYIGRYVTPMIGHVVSGDPSSARLYQESQTVEQVIEQYSKENQPYLIVEIDGEENNQSLVSDERNPAMDEYEIIVKEAHDFSWMKPLSEFTKWLYDFKYRNQIYTPGPAPIRLRDRDNDGETLDFISDLFSSDDEPFTVTLKRKNDNLRKVEEESEGVVYYQVLRESPEPIIDVSESVNSIDPPGFFAQNYYAQFNGKAFTPVRDGLFRETPKPGMEGFYEVYTYWEDSGVNYSELEEVIQLMATQDTVDEKVGIAEEWFIRNFVYSIAEEGYNLSDWINGKYVKCDTANTLFTYVLREADIPVRYVTGVVSDGFIYGGHAWVNYWDGSEQAWNFADATPTVKKPGEALVTIIDNRDTSSYKDWDSEELSQGLVDNTDSVIEDSEREYAEEGELEGIVVEDSRTSQTVVNPYREDVTHFSPWRTVEQQEYDNRELILEATQDTNVEEVTKITESSLEELKKFDDGVHNEYYVPMNIFTWYDGWNWWTQPAPTSENENFVEFYTSWPKEDIHSEDLTEVHSIMAEKETIDEKVMAAHSWFVENFVYDIKLNADNLEEAMEERKVICGTANATFAYILRTGGIPTRYVTGLAFFDQDRTRYGYHAWLNYYDLDEGAWNLIDGTPGELFENTIATYTIETEKGEIIESEATYEKEKREVVSTTEIEVVEEQSQPNLTDDSELVDSIISYVSGEEDALAGTEYEGVAGKPENWEDIDVNLTYGSPEVKKDYDVVSNPQDELSSEARRFNPDPVSAEEVQRNQISQSGQDLVSDLIDEEDIAVSAVMSPWNIDRSFVSEEKGDMHIEGLQNYLSHEIIEFHDNVNPQGYVPIENFTWFDGENWWTNPLFDPDEEVFNDFYTSWPTESKYFDLVVGILGGEVSDGNVTEDTLESILNEMESHPDKVAFAEKIVSTRLDFNLDEISHFESFEPVYDFGEGSYKHILTVSDESEEIAYQRLQLSGTANTVLTYLLRKQEIPARLVYGVKILDEEHYVLHTWVNYYDKNEGFWKSADATPKLIENDIMQYNYNPVEPVEKVVETEQVQETTEEPVVQQDQNPILQEKDKRKYDAADTILDYMRGNKEALEDTQFNLPEEKEVPVETEQEIYLPDDREVPVETEIEQVTPSQEYVENSDLLTEKMRQKENREAHTEKEEVSDIDTLTEKMMRRKIIDGNLAKISDSDLLAEKLNRKLLAGYDDSSSVQEGLSYYNRDELIEKLNRKLAMNENTEAVSEKSSFPFGYVALGIAALGLSTASGFLLKSKLEKRKAEQQFNLEFSPLELLNLLENEQEVSEYLTDRKPFYDLTTGKKYIRADVFDTLDDRAFSLFELKKNPTKFRVSFERSHMDDIYAEQGYRIIDGQQEGVQELLRVLGQYGIDVVDTMDEEGYVPIAVEKPKKEKPLIQKVQEVYHTPKIEITEEEVIEEEEPDFLTLVRDAAVEVGLAQHISNIQYGVFNGEGSTYHLETTGNIMKRTQLLINPNLEDDENPLQTISKLFHQVVTDLPVQKKGQMYSEIVLYEGGQNV